MDIEWQEGAVCFAYREQVFACDNGLLDSQGLAISPAVALEAKDFQLNTIKQGDCISVLELDTEQRYNNAVEVFGLFGFKGVYSYDDFPLYAEKFSMMIATYGDIEFCKEAYSEAKRKLTYLQLMAIGELKRLELERSAPKASPDLEKDGSKYHREIIGLDGVKTAVDVYRVLDSFKTGCAATDHAIKKMLCAGLRGHKDKLTDYDNAIESLQAAKELLIQKSSNENTR